MSRTFRRSGSEASERSSPEARFASFAVSESRRAYAFAASAAVSGMMYVEYTQLACWASIVWARRVSSAFWRNSGGRSVGGRFADMGVALRLAPPYEATRRG